MNIQYMTKKLKECSNYNYLFIFIASKLQLAIEIDARICFIN